MSGLTTVNVSDLLNRINRSFVGFDELRRGFEGGLSFTDGFPPVNLIKFQDDINDDQYIIELAVAGFKEDQISIMVERSTLTIKGNKSDTDKSDDLREKIFIYKGIAERNFTRQFKLAEFVEVESAKLQDGILTVHLVKKIPEDKKVKTIKINS